MAVALKKLGERQSGLGSSYFRFQQMKCWVSYRLERLHKDAFDRMIIWQAIKNDMILISKDERMPQYEKCGLQLIW